MRSPSSLALPLPLRKRGSGLAFTLLLTGCPGNDKVGVDTGVDPADYPDDEVVTSFISFSSHCQGDALPRSLTGLQVHGYDLHGFDDGVNSSRLPTDVASTRAGQLVYAFRHENEAGCGGAALYGAPTGLSGDWTSTSDPDDLANCFGNPDTTGCGEGDANSCSGEYGVWIFRDDAAGALCSDYDPVHIELTTSDLSARRASSDEALGASGSGTFQLIPLRARDRDHDGSASVTFVPIQIDGTGVMTNLAWVTQIDVVEDQGYTLKVVKPDQEILWNDLTDELGISTDAFTLSEENPFDEEDVSGNPVFVVEEMDPDDAGGLQITMTWSADVGPTLIQAPGYVFSLDDIGCDGPQRFVMRLYGDPLWVAFELYGNPNLSWAMPTTPAGGSGRAFSTSARGLALAGVVLSHDSQDAEVVLTTIAWQNLGVCEEDTYTFPAE